LRGDGTPTYLLAVVVDDHDMGVTHVIRGDDHLNNAARQQQIYEAMGWPVPNWSHVPLIHGQDGAKLSKRHGALGVDAYRDDGFLPEGLCNYLLRLGWSHGDEEIIPRTRALEIFDVSGINKAPSRLDLDKLRSVNAHYLHALSDAEFVRRATPFLEAAGRKLDGEGEARFQRGAAFVRSRASTLKDAVLGSDFLFPTRPIALAGKAAKPLEAPGAKARLSRLANVLAECKNWNDANGLEHLLKEFAQAEGVGFGEVGPALRAALTGGTPSPALGEVLYALGRDEALSRVRDQSA
ncbi:MAG: glutamate--tRNA ligase, partial [Parvularculaceae bacterium]|nr:glutamate--tRNA ligase [Parvularculaceae bacterium]